MPLRGSDSGEASDSEEELAAFCPTVSLFFLYEISLLKKGPLTKQNLPKYHRVKQKTLEVVERPPLGQHTSGIQQ